MAPERQPAVKVAPLTTDPGIKTSVIVPKAFALKSCAPCSCFCPAMASTAPVSAFITTAYIPSE